MCVVSPSTHFLQKYWSGYLLPVTYHTCICGCDDVIKNPTYLNGVSLASSHESFPHCSVRNSFNFITFPNYSLDLYHLTKARCYGPVSGILRYPLDSTSRLRPSRSRLVAFLIRVQSIRRIPIFDMHFEGIRRILSFLTCPELFPCILLLFYCY